MRSEILNIEFLANSYIRQLDKANITKGCLTFINFCYSNGFFKSSIVLENTNSSSKMAYYDDELSEIGNRYFEELLDKWLSYIDRTQKYDDTEKLKKLFESLKK